MWRTGEDGSSRGMRRLSAFGDKFMILIANVVSQVDTFVRTYEIVQSLFCHFLKGRGGA